jgi:SAM-dependent methyltransferase
MNPHSRYLHQATWTRELRRYLFEKAGIKESRRILEVGCGTGAILREIDIPAPLHGLDLDLDALSMSSLHAPSAFLAQADAHFLPYADKSFDIVYCHFLLLWVKDPLLVIKEMARVGRHILALAEPDYSSRIDEPIELNQLGKWQTEALQRRGANTSFGARLAETFFQAGIKLIETGPIQNAVMTRSAEEWENEWATLQVDLEGNVPDEEIQKMKKIDEEARRMNARVLNVPTYFAYGVV